MTGWKMHDCDICEDPNALWIFHYPDWMDLVIRHEHLKPNSKICPRCEKKLRNPTYAKKYKQ